MSDDLVEWLRAQLDEGERLARLIELGHPWPWHEYASGFGATMRCCDAGRLLREVEAKRKILDWIAGELADDPEVVVPMDLLRDLAQVYSDRPGYRKEWRPA